MITTIIRFGFLTIITPPTITGVILPPATPAGTLTRRATERTWLTASNVHKVEPMSLFEKLAKQLSALVFQC